MSRKKLNRKLRTEKLQTRELMAADVAAIDLLDDQPAALVGEALVGEGESNVIVESEPNGTRTFANELGSLPNGKTTVVGDFTLRYSSRYRGLPRTMDDDYFKFELDSPSDLKIDLQTMRANFGFDVSLRDSLGRTVGDDFFVQRNASARGEFSDLSAGTYYLQLDAGVQRSPYYYGTVNKTEYTVEINRVSEQTPRGGDSNERGQSVGQLRPGDYVVTPSFSHSIVMQSDGNLVLWSRDHGPLWSSATWGQSVTDAVMQNDGNFALFNNGSQVWSSGTRSNVGATMRLSDSGDLTISTPNGKILWSATKDVVRLGKGHQIGSENGQFSLALQEDGNLVLWSKEAPLWSTNTYGQSVTHAEVQDDGNFVIYDGSTVVWNSGTWGNSPS